MRERLYLSCICSAWLVLLRLYTWRNQHGASDVQRQTFPDFMHTPLWTSAWRTMYTKIVTADSVHASLMTSLMLGRIMVQQDELRMAWD